MADQIDTELVPVTRSSYLQIADTSTVTESGNIYSFTSQETFRLNNFSGDTSELWDYYDGSSASGAYIGISGNMGNTTLASTPDSLPGGYRMVGSTTLNNGTTMTLEEGVCITMVPAWFYVNGSLNVLNETEADAFVVSGTSGSMVVGNGGVLNFANANIRLTGATGYNENNLEVKDGGIVNMEGGALSVQDRTVIRAGGVVNLTGVSVSNSTTSYGMSIYGSVKFEDCRMNGRLQVGSGGVFVMSGGTFSGRMTAQSGSKTVLTDTQVTIMLTFEGGSVAELDNVTCTTLQVGGGTSLTVGDRGVTMTSSEVVRFNGRSGNYVDFLRSFKWNATTSTTFVGICGTIYGRAQLDDLSGIVTGGYHMVWETTVGKGATVTMGEGVCITLDISHNFYVKGTFIAENEETTDVLYASGSRVCNYIVVDEGGRMILRNANISLLGTWGSNGINVSNGTFDMEGGRINLRSGSVSVGGSSVLNLTGVDVTGGVNGYSGAATIKDCTISDTVTVIDGCAFDMSGCTVKSQLFGENNSKIRLSGTRISGMLTVFGRGELDDVTCTMLRVGAFSSLTTGEEGVTMTGNEVLRISDNCGGDYAEFLRSFKWKATASTTYVGMYGTLVRDVVLKSLDGLVTDGYRLVGNMNLNNGATMTMGEGVSITFDGNYSFYVKGIFKAENEEVADVLKSSGKNLSSYLCIQDGGRMDLHNANISLQGTWTHFLQVENGTLNMNGGEINMWSSAYVDVQSAGVLNLADVSVANAVNVSGKATLDNCRFNSEVTLKSGSVTEVVNCTQLPTLTIEKGCKSATVKGCDLSKTKITLSGSGNGIIDLSGNYWGTSDINAVISRISGYNADTVILDDILLVDPNTEFALLGTNLKKNTLSGTTTEFEVQFSHELDPASLRPDLIRLVDANGEDIAFTAEVQDKKLVFHFDPIEAEGKVCLYLNGGIKDLGGETYVGPANSAYDLKLTCDKTPPLVDHVTPGGDFAGTFTSFTVYFNSTVDATSLKQNVWLENPSGKKVQVESLALLSDSSVRFNVAQQTAYGTYTIHVGADVCDYAGNKLDQNGNGTGGEAGDSFAASFNLTEIDLSISTVTAAGDMVSGTLETVSWVGLNDTEYALSGSWTDGVYLSRDERWDIGDTLLGSYTHTGGLPMGGTYSGSATFSVPGVTPGAYFLLVRSDVYGQEMADKEPAEYAQNLTAVPVYIGMSRLGEGDAVQGTLTKEDVCDFYVVPAGGSKVVHLALDALADGAKVEVYTAYGKVPDRDNFDKSFVVGAEGLTALLEGNDSYDDLYIMVNKHAGSAACDYTMSAEFRSMAITGVTPGVYNVGGTPVFDIYGANFASTSTVEFIGADGKVYTPESVTWVSASRLKANFAEGVLPVGKLDVRVVSNGASCCAEDIVDMVSSGGAQFLLDTKAPSSLGYHLISTIRVNFENVGWESMDAPIVFVTVEQNGEQRAMLTMDKSLLTQGFWTATYPEGFSTSVSFLAANTGAGTLSPTGSYWDHYVSASGSSTPEAGDVTRKDAPPLQNSVDIYYSGWQQPWDGAYPKFEIKVSYLSSDNTETMDWAGLLERSSFSESEKASLSKSLPETVGTTIGDFVKYMDRTLAYLDGLGVDTAGMEMTDLMHFCLKNVLGRTTTTPILASAVDMVHTTSAMELAVYRAFGSDLESRNLDGAFGYGWSFNWDLHLEELEDGGVVITQDGLQCTLQPDFRGGYVGLADGSSLKKKWDGSYVLSNADVGKMEFAANGHIRSITAAEGASLSFSYDAAGNLSKITSSSGESISFEWEGGHIVRMMDGKGNTNSYSYEGGNLVSITSSNGDTVSYGYSSEWQHALTSVTDKDGTRYEYTYNQYGLLENSSLTAADGSVSGYAGVGTSYGEFGEVTVSDVFGNTTTYYYDHLGLVRRAVDVDGNTVNYAYDAKGNLTRVEDQAGNVSRYEYDSTGNLIRFTDAAGHITGYSYTGDGALSGITDANGNSISYGYDEDGYASAIIYADGTREDYGRDADGNVISTTSRSGQLTSFTYDAKGNVLGVTYSDGSTVAFSYDTDNRPVVMTGSNGETVTLTYNEQSYLTGVDYGNGQVLAYEYGEDGRLVSMTDAAGNKTCYSYDALGQLTRVTDADGSLIVAYEYDLAGQITKSTNGNGTYSVYTYTKSGKPECVTNYAADGSVQSFSRNVYGPSGLCVERESQDGVWNYEYDATGQLLHAVFTPAEGSGAEAQDLVYEYDAAGNRIRSVVNGVETLYSNNALNQTVSAGGAVLEYDEDGNLIRKTDSTGVTTYEYNAIGKLSRMVTATGSVHEYSYNALGHRVAVTVDGVTTRYVYDLSGNLLNTYDADGNLGASYRYGMSLLGYADAADQVFYYQGDILGSVAGTTDASGNLVSLQAYSPFGERLSSSITAGSEELFGWLGLYGLQSDASGQVYMNARYYDQTTGTFTQADPIGVQGGLNLYAYCGNNPVSYVDPSGGGCDNTG